MNGLFPMVSNKIGVAKCDVCFATHVKGIRIVGAEHATGRICTIGITLCAECTDEILRTLNKRREDDFRQRANFRV